MNNKWITIESFRELLYDGDHWYILLWWLGSILIEMRTVENQYCLNLTDCQSWIKVCQGGSSKFSFTGKLSLKGSVNEYIKHRPTFPPGLGNQTQLARTGGAKIFWFFVKSTNVRNYLKRGNTQIRLSWESGSCIINRNVDKNFA